MHRLTGAAAALLLGVLALGPARAQTVKYLNQLSGAAAVAGTNTLPLCQTAGDCGSGVPLVSATVTQLATYFQSLLYPVPLGDIAGIAQNTVLGSVTTGTNAPAALTAAQLTTLCDVFTAALSGCVPASGGGTTDFLRADGTWAAVSGGSSTFTAGVGLTSSPGTDNTGSQTVANGSTLSPQQWASAYTANHTVALADGTLLYVADGTGAITFTLPQSASSGDAKNGNFSPCFLDESGYGFTLATTTSVFYGAPGVSGSSASFPPQTEVCASPDGTNWALMVVPNNSFTIATNAHAQFGGLEGEFEGALGQ